MLASRSMSWTSWYHINIRRNRWNKRKRDNQKVYDRDMDRTNNTRAGRQSIVKKPTQNTLYLIDRFIPPPTRTSHPQPKRFQEALTPRIVVMLHFSSLRRSHPLGLFESFKRNIVQLPIFDANLPPHRPEILTIPHDTQIKRIPRARTRRCERETMRGSPPRKPVEPE